jgi:hypothetical protein
MAGLFLGTDMGRLFVAWLMLLGGADVWATLGKAPMVPVALPADTFFTARRLAATPSARPSLYTLHENVLENGTRVLEYASAEGVVFAVAWRGPVLPDLNALLGDYFSTFKMETDQAREAGKRGSPVHVVTDALVVRSGGRMRNFFGHAYAPGLIPLGVNIKDVFQ